MTCCSRISQPLRVLGCAVLVVAHVAAQDPNSSAALVQLAREGNPAACYALGLAHESGAGRARDLTEAARLYTIAANAGIASAQARLAFLYQTGAGVPRDLAKALELYRQAAATDPDAQFQLALALVNGTGTAPDPAAGRLLLAEAATAEHQEAQLMLGLMMAQGQGGPRNEFGARRWMQARRQDQIAMSLGEPRRFRNGSKATCLITDPGVWRR